MVNEFYSYGDGSSLYLIDISNRLKQIGYNISILFGTLREKQVEDSRIASFYVPDCFGFNYSYGADEKKQIKAIIDHVDPDIIYIHQVLNPYIIDLLASTKPSIRFEHGFRLSCITGRRMPRSDKNICEYSPGIACFMRAYSQKCSPRNPLLAFRRIKDFYLNKKAHNKLARIIVASSYIKNLLLKSGYHDNRVEVIPYYTTLYEQSRRKDPPQVPTIICVARLEAEKGIDYLLKALSMVSIKTKAFIIGEGSQISYLKQMAKSLSAKHEIIFTGWIENNELMNFYTQATLAVVPSIWPEPFGIIGIEAMANQVPVVAFNVGGISDWLIDGETGYLVSPQDVKTLAKKINYILENPCVAKRMGINGRELVKEKFIASTHIDSLLPVFEQAFENFSKIIP